MLGIGKILALMKFFTWKTNERDAFFSILVGLFAVSNKSGIFSFQTVLNHISSMV